LETTDEKVCELDMVTRRCEDPGVSDVHLTYAGVSLSSLKDMFSVKAKELLLIYECANNRQAEIT